MRGFGGMVTIVLKTDLAGTRRFLENTHLFSLAESLGGVESLINHPALMTHGSIPPETRASLGITDSLVRLSVGVEDVGDLIDDLRDRLRGNLGAVSAPARDASRPGCDAAFDEHRAAAVRSTHLALVESRELRIVEMGSSFGQLFRITTWGESHGGAVGVVIDGCPPRIELSEEDIQRELDRRRPGQSEIVTQRNEADRCRDFIRRLRRPDARHAHLDPGEEQRCAAGSVSEMQNDLPSVARRLHLRSEVRHPKLAGRWPRLRARNHWARRGRRRGEKTPEQTLGGAFRNRRLVVQIHEVTAQIDRTSVQADAVERNAVRCPDEAAAELMTALIQSVRAEGDSLGGMIECVIRGVPAGLGEPVFDKLEADLAKAMLSLPASKGFEIGSGFAATRMKGSEHNDPFEVRDEKVRTTTNNSGGVQGGISNGEEIFFRVAFKPTATIARDQKTVTRVAARKRRWPLAAATIHVSCLVRCRSSKRWPRWFFAITPCVSGRLQFRKRISESKR